MNNQLIQYINESVLPLYERNDYAHQLWHITGVIERSLNIASNYDIDINMVYTIAAFHDLACYISREDHEKKSAILFLEDEKINAFFDNDQRKIIKEAIEDHRGSLNYEPRSIYGKIIATADRFITINDILKSVCLHNFLHNPGIAWEAVVQNCYDYINNKYGENGYAKAPIETTEYNTFLKNVRELLKNKEQFSHLLKITELELRQTYSDFKKISWK